MANERNIEILEYRITKITEKINLYTLYNISQKKIDALILMKEKYEAQLAEYQT